MRRAAIFAFLLLWTLPVAAQESPPEPRFVGFPVPEITERAEELDERLRALTETLAPDREVARIREALPAAKRALDEQAGATLGQLAGVELAEVGELDRE